MVPGPCRLPTLAVPKRPIGGSAADVPALQSPPGHTNPEERNHWLALGLPGEAGPTRSGNWLRPSSPMPVPEGSAPEEYGVRKGPDCTSRILLSCQTPIMPLRMGLEDFAKR